MHRDLSMYVLRAGHRNAQTVKGINFMGERDEWVVSGSDCGHIFVWGAADGVVKTMLKGDRHVVNCLEPHPHAFLTLATSGIEDDVKLWAPTAAEPVHLDAAAQELMDVNQARQHRQGPALRHLTLSDIRMLLGTELPFEALRGVVNPNWDSEDEDDADDEAWAEMAEEEEEDYQDGPDNECTIM
jgi:WD repeat-containing protein 42A